MTQTINKHWYDMVDLDTPNFPRYHLTHYNGSKKYMIMVLSWDVEKGVADGLTICYNKAKRNTNTK